MWQTLRFVLHHLEPEDYAACMALCHGSIEAVNNEHLLAHILLEQSPKASTRRISQEYGIPNTTVWQTLHFVFHHLEPKDYATCMVMCHGSIEAVINEHLLAHILLEQTP